MADFKGTILTTAGRNLLAKALTGAKLEFTKVQLGDGVWDESVNPESLTSLVNPKLDLPINDFETIGDGTVRLRVLLTNTGLTEGFFTRELGIFAKDPDTGEEVLYSVAYAENPDYIPSDGVTKVENVFDVYTVIANAQNVTAVISDTVVLATKQDIEAHNRDSNAHADIRQALNSHIEDLNAHDIPSQISSAIVAHNQNPNAHEDIRNALHSFISQFEGDLSDIGYYKLPNGLIIQWGTVLISNGHGIVTLPITFPNKFLTVVATDVGDGTHVIGVSPYSNSQIEFWSYDPRHNVIPPATGIHFVAIGY